MTDRAGAPAFRVREASGRFELVNPAERVILVCGDEASADHYAVLLNEAYENGYRAGRRDGERRE